MVSSFSAQQHTEGRSTVYLITSNFRSTFLQQAKKLFRVQVKKKTGRYIWIRIATKNRPFPKTITQPVKKPIRGILPFAIPTHELRQAYRLLFGAQPPFPGDPVAHLCGGSLKKAYINKAMETHPDRATLLSLPESVLNERFKEVHLAYEKLKAAISVIHTPPPPGQPNRAVNPGRPDRGGESADKRTGHFFRGPLPPRKLLLGQYLYYTGRISWRTLIEAVAWQRSRRPRIGQIALDWGILSARDINSILIQRQREHNHRLKFAEFALQRGYITLFEHMALLGRQRRLQPLIGAYFIENRFLRPVTVEKGIKDLGRHNRLIKTRHP